MRNRGRIHCLIAIIAATFALGALAAAPAGAAGAPIGETLATGAAGPSSVDPADGRVVWSQTSAIVRTRGPEPAATRDYDVSAGCTAQSWSPWVAASTAGGAAMLWCVPDAQGSPNRVLDLATGAVVKPPNVDQVGGSTYGVLTPAGIVFRYDDYHGTAWTRVLDWRTGEQRPQSVLAPACDDWRADGDAIERCDGSGRARLPAGYRFDVSHGFATFLRSRAQARLATLSAYLPECGALLSWDVGGEVTIGHQQDGFVLGDAGPLGPGEKSWTITRVSLAGICARTGDRWPLRLSSRGTTVGGRPFRVTGARDALTGSTAGVAAFVGGNGLPSRLPTLRVRAGGQVVVKTAAPATQLRWRIARGRWHVAGGSGSRWTLKLPARLRARQGLVLSTRLQDGTATQTGVRLLRAGR